MANSRRVYITLNADKEKDRAIEELLSNSYSEGDFIKETLYRLATQSDNLQLINTNSTRKVQKITDSNKEVTKVTKPKSNSKVQKGTINNNKDKKVIKNSKKILIDDDSDNKALKNTNNSSTEKVQNNDNNTDAMQQDINNDDMELMNNLSSNLDKYF